MEMRVRGFEWDEGNAEKNYVKHGVSIREAEESFFNKCIQKKGKRGRYYLYSVSNAGRYIFIVFVWKLKGIVRVISARDMSKKEKKFYNKGRI